MGDGVLQFGRLLGHVEEEGSLDLVLPSKLSGNCWSGFAHKSPVMRGTSVLVPPASTAVHWPTVMPGVVAPPLFLTVRPSNPLTVGRLGGAVGAGRDVVQSHRDIVEAAQLVEVEGRALPEPLAFTGTLDGHAVAGRAARYPGEVRLSPRARAEQGVSGLHGGALLAASGRSVIWTSSWEAPRRAGNGCPPEASLSEAARWAAPACAAVTRMRMGVFVPNDIRHPNQTSGPDGTLGVTRVGGDPCQRQATESSLAASHTRGSKKVGTKASSPWSYHWAWWRAHSCSARSPDRRPRRIASQRSGVSGRRVVGRALSSSAGEFGVVGALGEVPDDEPAVQIRRAPHVGPQSPLVHDRGCRSQSSAALSSSLRPWSHQWRTWWARVHAAGRSQPGRCSACRGASAGDAGPGRTSGSHGPGRGARPRRPGRAG